MKIGIIGGSGMDDPKFVQDYKEENIETKYGKPSSPIICGKISGVDVCILARHGKKHEIAPSQINYRANIAALRMFGCTHIIATSAVGSLKEGIEPGDLVFPNQFIDFTKQRKLTFFDNIGEVKHEPMSEPFSASLRTILIETATELGFKKHNIGTIVVIEGPRFSTRSESFMFRKFADVIGMTTVPEAQLAREAGIEYAIIAMSTDYDCWKKDEAPVTFEMVMKRMEENADKVKKLILKVIEKLSKEQFTGILKKVAVKLNDAKIDWVLYGSTNFKLQGMDIIPNDIDISVNSEDVPKVKKLFSEYKFSEDKQFVNKEGLEFKIYIDNIEVQICADYEHGFYRKLRLDKNNINKIKLGDVEINSFNLDAEVMGYEYLQRHEKATKIREFIGKDLDKSKEFIKSKIRTIPDFPKKGIMFRDVTTLFKDAEGMKKVIEILHNRYKDKKINVVAGIEARGFILGGILAEKLGVGFVPIRKKGKLPAETERLDYALEYGMDSIEIHKDAIKKGENVLLIDDLIATGGTALASCQLIEKLGGKVHECVFVVDLPDLKGKEKLSKYEVFSVVEFAGE